MDNHNGTCAASTDTISITVDPLPTVANAGVDQTICAPTATLAANTPIIGTGAWTVIAGTGAVTTANDPNSGVTGLTTGVNTFVWTITNGTCAASTDTISITLDPLPTVAVTGVDQTICIDTATISANTPIIGTGVWTVIAGAGTVVNPTSPTTGVTGLLTSVNTFVWTISNGTCAASSDTITINVDPLTSAANAGPDQTICTTTSTLAANIPAIGIGSWTVIAGTAIVTNPANPASAVTGLSSGLNTFVWSISNGTCATRRDTVNINVDAIPTTANAGTDQSICSATSATLNANTPTVGTGTWTVIAGTGAVTITNNPNSGVTGLTTGVNTFVWTITNGSCAASKDTVSIGIADSATIANAGANQTLCNDSVFMNANAALVGQGTWSLISGSGIFANANSATTLVTGVGIGTNIFQWTISNNPCPSSSAQVTITNVCAPIAVDDIYTTPFQTVLNGTSVLSNDTDPNGSTLTVTVLTTTTNGILVMNLNGTFTYTPANGFSGIDTFVYVICNSNNLCDTAVVTITVGNGSPVANVDHFATPFNTAFSDTVIVNDFDPNGDSLVVSIVSTTSNGTLVMGANGIFNYTPNAGFSGVDTFIYNLCDTRIPPACDTAIVFIYVGNIAPVATFDTYTTPTNTTLTGSTVLANDFDPNNDPLTITLISGTTNGTIVLNANGTFTYVPNTAYHGPDSFIYRICDNGNPILCDTAIVFITVLNAAPIANADTYPTIPSVPISGGTVFVNDSDPNNDPYTMTVITQPTNGTLTMNLATGTFLYNPNGTSAISDFFIYEICDNQTPPLCDTAIVWIRINQPPQGIDHYDTTSVNVAISNSAPQENLLFGVTDPNGDNVFVIPVLNATTSLGGTITIDSLGNYTYTPPFNVTNADDYFVYTICDDGSPKNCVTYTLHIYITPVFYPEGFSPNGDGVNDYLIISGADALRVGLTVFNRWGNKVFEDNNYKNTWNGSANKGIVIGEGLPDGTYWYIVDLFDGKEPQIHILTIKR
jgi:gliding motility-associated-like protein